MNRINNLGKMTFSKKQKDAVDFGVELVKQYKYENKNTNGIYNKYAQFSNTIVEDGVNLTYTQKNKIFHNMAIDEAYEISGLDKERFNVAMALSNPNFEWAYFAVVEEVINKVTAKTEIEDAMRFAEVRNLADGDSQTFHIPSKHLLVVSTVANGVRNSHIQKLFQEEITLTPVAKKASIGFDLYQISAGTVDYGYMIDRITTSFKVKLQREVIEMMFGAFTTLATPFKENAYNQDSYIRLQQRVSAANNSQATVYGTLTALNKVVPQNDYFKMGLGQAMVTDGYIQNAFRVPTQILNQSVDPNSAYDFAISNDYLLFLSA